MARKSSTPQKVKIFASASFFNDMGSDMIYPIWPLFVTSFLGANMSVLGLLDGLGQAMEAISQAAGGYYSDRWKRRKPFVWLGYLMGSASRLGYASASAWTHLIPFRLLDRSGKMRSAPRDAIIADVSTAKSRGSNFGVVRAMDHLGAVTGVLICILLLAWLSLDYRTIFIIAAAPSMVSSILILKGIREPREKRTTIFKGLTLGELNSNFRLFLASSLLFALSTFSYSFLLIFASEYGFSRGIIPIFYLLFSVIASLSSLPFGRLADRIGRKPVMQLAMLLWGVICLLLVIYQSVLGLIVAFLLYGLHLGALEPVQKTFVVELVSSEHRASALGFFQLALGMSALPASLIAGRLWDTMGRTAPFILSLLLTVCALVMLNFVSEPQQEPETA